MAPLKILLVNEDGCFAPGIIALAKVLAQKHHVVVVGPLREQPGKGHRLTTSTHPLRAEQFFILNKVKVFGVNGTPCDCVLLALDKLLKSKPDLIISGIDHKHNRGEPIYQSAVVSAAIEGTIQGIKSIAISANIKTTDAEKSFLPVARAFMRRLPYFYDNIPLGTTININFPTKYNTKKIKVCPLTLDLVREIHSEYREETNPFGTTFYWRKTPLAGTTLGNLDQRADVYWLKKGFITVTPLKLDLTDDAVYEELLELFK